MTTSTLAPIVITERQAFTASDGEAQTYSPKNTDPKNEPKEKTENDQTTKKIHSSEIPQKSQKAKKPWQITLEKFSKNEFIQTLPFLGMWASIILNGLSAAINFLPSMKEYRGITRTLEKFGTKSFQLTNGNVNTLEQLPRKNYLLAAGYFLENPIAAFVKRSQTFLARGVVSGTYTIMNAIKIITGKLEYDSIADNLATLGKGLGASAENLSKGTWKNLKSADTALMSIISGFGKILGTALWGLTGSEKLGAIFRNGSGFIQIIDQLKPGNFKERLPYWLCGLFTGIGTLSDLASKWFKTEYLVPLSLATDCLGIYFLRTFQNTVEKKEDPKS